MSPLKRTLTLVLGAVFSCAVVAQDATPSKPATTPGKSRQPLSDAYPSDTEEPGDPTWVRGGTATAPQVVEPSASSQQAVGSGGSALQTESAVQPQTLAEPAGAAAPTVVAVPPATVQQSQPALIAGPRLPPADVLLDDQPVFSINARLGQYGPADRAGAITAKLERLEQSRHLDPGCVVPLEHEGSTDIVCHDAVLVTTTDQDAYFDPLGRTRQALAAAHADAIREALARVQDEYSASSLSLGALKSVGAALVLVLILIGLHLLFPYLYKAIHKRRGTHIRPVRIQRLELLSEERLTELLVQVAHLARLVVTLVFLYFFIPLVFSFFAPTRRFGHRLVEYVLGPVHRGWLALLNYIPSLLVVLIVCFFTFQALKLARFLFREIERGNLVVPGFFPEWAMPTSRIVDVLLIAFAIVIAFPYLPGSDSAAFKGVSIFLGVLLSLGSSTAIANVVAGVMLTYTRAFRIGDRVQIADTVGDVIEKTLLATHLRTIKNVDVTVPNGLVLASHIVNFSRATTARPLILNAGITVGYDVPWRQVHELLIAAAADVEGVLEEPAPFVLQTSLDDFYVSYQINAYTSSPARMAGMYSELNQQILDRFAAAGIDATAPHYNVMIAPDRSGLRQAQGQSSR